LLRTISSFLGKDLMRHFSRLFTEYGPLFDVRMHVTVAGNE